MEELQAELQAMQQQMGQMQQRINQQAQQLQQAQQQVVAQQVAPAAPVFALTPASLAAGAFIDYGSQTGIKLFKRATESLSQKHDLDQENLQVFLEAVRSRAIEQGWLNTILTITVNGAELKLIDNYGALSDAIVRRHALTYAFQDVRAAQDSANLFTSLELSMTVSAWKTISAEKANFTIKRKELPAAQQIQGQENDEYRDGVLLLWTIINHTTAKTNATISVIVEQLTSLPATMMEHNSDVKVFNTTVRTLLNSYYANKRESYDKEVLLQTLFKSYKQCSDKVFVDYIERKEQDHEDGTAILTADTLLDVALKQYQTRQQKKIWGEDSAEHKELLNLTAQLMNSNKEITDLKKKLTITPKKQFGKSSKPKPTWDKNRRSTNKTVFKKRDPKEAEAYRKERYDKAPQWMKERPNDTKSSKVHDGKKYFWCEHHNLWQFHKSNDCRLQYRPHHDNTKKDDKPKLKLQEKLNMMAPHDDDDYDL